jgi:hypothetical protein
VIAHFFAIIISHVLHPPSLPCVITIVCYQRPPSGRVGWELPCADAPWRLATPCGLAYAAATLPAPHLVTALPVSVSPGDSLVEGKVREW